MKPALLTLAAFLTASPALANDDMLGTFFGGRSMGDRQERSVRVNDPEMDREEMLRDRQERQERAVRQIERDEDEAARKAAEHHSAH